ncbi:MAG TPA: AraC family transcriptional regulator [Puia sp.]|nr:AraC family transcriptional regulator [Puia sp.]
MQNVHQLQHNLLYSCNEMQKRSKEQLVQEHSLSYLISGEIEFYTNVGITKAIAGSIGFAKRNELVKSLKIPGPNGEPCKSISIFLDQEALRRYSSENDIKSNGAYKGASIVQLSDDFIKGYFDSLLPYFDHPTQLTKPLARLKTNEAIELLLRYDPKLKDLLFDFSEPHKIDLEAYMNQNYKYNVSLKQFAKLTGRSLATFKRDFEKIFRFPPQKWLLKKRLQEAHFLIAERKQKPSDAYIEAGFENLSHFSSSFKQLFGYNPSSLVGQYAK